MNKHELFDIIRCRRNAGSRVVIAHRGVSIGADSVISALSEASVAPLIDGIEFDVQVSGDGKAFVYHDFFCQVGKRRDRVAKLAYQSIRDSVGASDCPLLADVLDLLRDYDGVIDIDLKQVGTFPVVLSDCQKAGVLRRCIFTSACLDVHREVADALPESARILFWPSDRGDNIYCRGWMRPFLSVGAMIASRLGVRLMVRAAERADAAILAVYHGLVSEELAGQLRDRGLGCAGVTVDLRREFTPATTQMLRARLEAADVDVMKLDFVSRSYH